MLDYMVCEPPPWVTYFIVAIGRNQVKIGRTRRAPRFRLMECQIGCPDTLELVGTVTGDREAELHARFAYARVRGEWFELNGALRDFLSAEFGWTPESGTVAAQLPGWTNDELLRFIKVDKSEVSAKAVEEGQLSACEHIERLSREAAYNKPGPLLKRLRAFGSLMEQWLADDSRCDAMTWPIVPEGLDINCKAAWRYLTPTSPAL